MLEKVVFSIEGLLEHETFEIITLFIELLVEKVLMLERRLLLTDIGLEGYKTETIIVGIELMFENDM